MQCSSPTVKDEVLLGVLATRQAGARYRIAPTLIVVSSTGWTARAGVISTPYRADRPLVQQAKVPTCWSTPIVTASGR